MYIEGCDQTQPDQEQQRNKGLLVVFAVGGAGAVGWLVQCWLVGWQMREDLIGRIRISRWEWEWESRERSQPVSQSHETTRQQGRSSSTPRYRVVAGLLVVVPDSAKSAGRVT